MLSKNDSDIEFLCLFLPILHNRIDISQLIQSHPITNKIRRIDTPDKFEKLKAGEYDVNAADIFHITMAAVDDIYPHLKHFFHAKYYQINYRNEMLRSAMAIRPNQKTIHAYGGSETSIRSLPSDYKAYSLAVSNVNVTVEDIDFIFQWTNARRLHFIGESAIPLQLQQQPSKLKELKNVERLMLIITSETYGELRIQSFIESLKSLELITILPSLKLYAEEFEEFVKNQIVPNGWKCAVVFNVNYKCDKLNVIKHNGLFPTIRIVHGKI